jgi:hypothetical protein
MLFTIIRYILRENENRRFCAQRKKTLLTENNIRPNRDDSDHVLFIPIDISLGFEQMIRYRCIKWPDIKSHKIRSVASRSRRVMILFNKWFIHQFKSNSLDSIWHINETNPTRNGRRAPWSSVVWSFEISKCDGAKCCDYVLGHNDTLYALWQWSVPFSTGLREIQSSISSNSISRSLYEMTLYQNKCF